MTLLCPLKAALNNAVDPSLKDNRKSKRLLKKISSLPSVFIHLL